MLTSRHLSFCLGHKKLLDAISYDFAPGKLYGILGPNGSGKSTFLKTLAGIWTPTAGTVLWEGEPLHQRSRKEISRTISLVPQQYPLCFDFKVEELVSMGRYAHGSAGSSGLALRALLHVDAWSFKDRLATELSQGERQRVFIARALATESPVILLDEPMASLDIRHQLDIWELLAMLARQKKVVIIAMHDLEATQRHCDEVLVLNEGRCAAQGEPRQALNDHCLQQVFGIRRTGAGWARSVSGFSHVD